MISFYIKQKVFSIGDKYNVYDDKQDLRYLVKGKVFTIGDKLRLYNVKSEEEVFFIKRKIFTFLPKYELYKNETLVANVSKKFTFFSHKIDISSKYGEFHVDGDFMSHDFFITLDGKEVASFHKKWFSFGDSYEILIQDDSNFEFYLALVIMIDNCIHNEDNNSN